MKNNILNLVQKKLCFTKIDLLELASLVGTSILVITFFILSIEFLLI